MNVFGAFHLLATTFLFTIVIWYMQFLWRRRRLYKFARQRPGPLGLPLIGNGLQFIGNNSDILYKILDFGKIYESPFKIWLGHRLFFGITKPKEFEVVLNSPNALTKEDLYKFAESTVGTGLFTASVPKWKRHKKVILPTFNQKILDGFVDVFSEQSEILVKQFKKKVGQGMFDTFDCISRCTLDVICETAMGVSVHAQETDSDFVKWANKTMEIMYLRMFKVWLHSDFIFNLTHYAREQQDVLSKMHAFTGKVVREKRKSYQQKIKAANEAYFTEEPQQRKSFLQQLIELSEAGANFTDEELREEVDTFMIAGSDTTASINSFVFIMLGMHQDIQEKVYKEVLDILGPDRSVNSSDLNKFQYLEQVIKETLRIFPVGPVIVRAATGDVDLGHFVIPKGSSIVLMLMALHRSPDIYPDPLKFDPERFLPEEVAKRHPYSWLPFSGGPRNCVGMKYAFMAMKTLIATVLRKYRISTDYKTPEDVLLRADLMIKPVNGYKIAIEPRD